MLFTFSLGPEAGTLTVQRESTDDPQARPSPRTKEVHGWGAESNLLYLMKAELKKFGFKLCRKKLSRDGHLMGDDHMSYLRTPAYDLRRRNVVDYPYLYIVDECYATRSSAEDYNGGEEVIFNVHGNVFTPDCPQLDWYKKVKALCDKAGIECELCGDAKPKEVTSV